MSEPQMSEPQKSDKRSKAKTLAAKREGFSVIESQICIKLFVLIIYCLFIAYLLL